MTTFYVTGLKFKSSCGHCSAIPNKVQARHNTNQQIIVPAFEYIISMIVDCFTDRKKNMTAAKWFTEIKSRMKFS